MKVLIFCYQFPPLGGGFGQEYVIAKELANAGHKVRYITANTKNSSAKKTEKIEGIEVIRINTCRTDRAKANFRDMLSYIKSTWFELDKIIDQFNPDICQLFFGIPTGVLIFHKKFKKYPTVLTALGSDVPGHNPDRYPLLYKLLTPITKQIWKRHDKLVANSNDLANEIKNIATNQKVKVIYNGIDIDQFKPDYSKKQSCLNFLYVGRLIPLKQVDKAIEVFTGVAKNLEQKAKFNIVGSGSEEDNLKKIVRKHKIEEKVNFLGFIPHDKIQAEFQKADFYLQFSLAEGMSNTIMEAMACGAVPVISDVGGGAMLVDHGKNGLIYKIDKIDRAPNDILRIINKNQNKIEKIGQAARSRIVNNFSNNALANNYLKLYQNTK